MLQSLVFTEHRGPSLLYENRQHTYGVTDSDLMAKILGGYQAIWNAANDLKNYWLFFRSVNGSELDMQKRNVDDGYM